MIENCFSYFSTKTYVVGTESMRRFFWAGQETQKKTLLQAWGTTELGIDAKKNIQKVQIIKNQELKKFKS